jgi:hypothetical protein
VNAVFVAPRPVEPQCRSPVVQNEHDVFQIGLIRLLRGSRLAA